MNNPKRQVRKASSQTEERTIEIELQIFEPKGLNLMPQQYLKNYFYCKTLNLNLHLITAEDHCQRVVA